MKSNRKPRELQLRRRRSGFDEFFQFHSLTEHCRHCGNHGISSSRLPFHSSIIVKEKIFSEWKEIGMLSLTTAECWWFENENDSCKVNSCVDAKSKNYYNRRGSGRVREWEKKKNSSDFVNEWWKEKSEISEKPSKGRKKFSPRRKNQCLSSSHAAKVSAHLRSRLWALWKKCCGKTKSFHKTFSRLSLSLFLFFSPSRAWKSSPWACLQL